MSAALEGEGKADEAPQAPLRPGLRVIIYGLTSEGGLQMNGKIARVMTDQSAATPGRVVVKVVGASRRPVQIRRINLRTGDDDRCRKCGKPEAASSCIVCREMGLPRTYYCDQDCQRADWKEHKKMHKAAKTALMIPVPATARKKAQQSLAIEAQAVALGLPRRGCMLKDAINEGKLEACRALVDW